MARILVVDDEPEIRIMLRQMLEESGHEVEEATNGEEASLLFRKSPADAVILDIVMPVQEGIETIIELRRDFPEAKIIAISGGARIAPDSYLQIAKRIGALHTFSKPFDKNEMLSAVNSLTA